MAAVAPNTATGPIAAHDVPPMPLPATTTSQLQQQQPQLPLPPAYREKVQQLKRLLLERRHWKVCRGQPTAAHKVPPTEFDPGEIVCRHCKQADPKVFVEPEEADAKIRELLAQEPCHFVPRYDQAGCGVDKDRPDFDAKRWTTWALKPGSRGTVLRERLWQCCLGGGKKAAQAYRSGHARNTSKIGCPRSLYAVTRWDGDGQKAKCVEIYFKHKHLAECFEHGAVQATASASWSALVHGTNGAAQPSSSDGSPMPPGTAPGTVPPAGPPVMATPTPMSFLEFPQLAANGSGAPAVEQYGTSPLLLPQTLMSRGAGAHDAEE
ncbi:hypothetical protein GGF31_003232 [Allomyces arbusculus]|nr:hypothetical protein GGF31_003232 [Allomyces arbusculus]